MSLTQSRFATHLWTIESASNVKTFFFNLFCMSLEKFRLKKPVKGTTFLLSLVFALFVILVWAWSGQFKIEISNIYYDYLYCNIKRRKFQYLSRQKIQSSRFFLVLRLLMLKRGSRIEKIVSKKFAMQRELQVSKW